MSTQVVLTAMPIDLKPYQIAVVIGRYQIFHIGHELLLQHALTIAKKVIIVIGSSHHARTPRNPFTWEERVEMIVATLTEQQHNQVICLPVRDYFNDQRWTADVKRQVHEHYSPRDTIALVGHKKPGDTSNYYLDHFPGWHLVEVESPHKVDAAELRKIYFETADIEVTLQNLASWVSEPVHQFLKNWCKKPDYSSLSQEYSAVIKEQEKCRRSAHSAILTSVHALIEANGRILFSRRNKLPGKGLWMLPGGFIGPYERLVQAALRQLREATNSSLSEKTLLKHLKQVKIFDHPNRSCLGRVITHVHWFQLPSEELPKSKATQQLSNNQWFPVEKIMTLEDQLYEDHFHIMDSCYDFLNNDNT